MSIFGISINPLNDTCKAIHGAAQLAEFLLGVIGFGIREIFDLLNIGEDLIVDAIEFVMFGVSGVPLPGKSKPDISERAFEIGHELLGYDIISLVEVWDDSSKNKILAFGNQLVKDSDANLKSYDGRCFTGPNVPLAGSWKQSGSGILVVVPQLKASDGGNRPYEPDGVQRNMSEGCDFGPLVDSDRFANKGVQLTIIDLGLGKLDLYSTHLYSGGDAVNAPALGLGEPTEDEKVIIKSAQVMRLVDFISSTHDPSHVAIVAGDFNIAANTNLYDTLIHALTNVLCRDFKPTTFDDLWTNPAYSDILANLKDQGRTNRDDPNDHGGSGHEDFSNVCAIKIPVSTVTYGNIQDFYCDDSKPDTGKSGERITRVGAIETVGVKPGDFVAPNRDTVDWRLLRREGCFRQRRCSALRRRHGLPRRSQFGHRSRRQPI